MKSQTTIKEIAQALQISISTVSRALQNNPRIGLKTRERVWEMAKKLHYIPNPAAMLLRKKQTMTIGVILPTLTEEFFSLAITGIEDVVMEKGYHVLVSQSRDSYEREKELVESFLRTRVDGVLVSVAGQTNHYAHFKKLEEYGIPTVFFDRVPRNLPAHKVRCNVEQGAKEAIQFLYDRGIRRIALLNGPSNLAVSDERLNGYLTALHNFNLFTSPRYIRSTNLSREDTWQQMEHFISLPEPPEAILCFNDYIALYAMQYGSHRGIRPNHDMAFISFANLPITQFMGNPPMASVEQFAYQMGSQAADLLCQCIDHPTPGNPYFEKIIETELVIHNFSDSDHRLHP
ncbi:MAG: LacI family DNA-binding transcriptional regulator [Spirosomataceae bacterium]